MPANIHSLPSRAQKRKASISGSGLVTVESLEAEITSALSAKTAFNQLADLLDLAYRERDAVGMKKAIYALYRIFVIVVDNGTLRVTGDEHAKVLKAWVWDKLNSFVGLLAGLLQDDEKLLRISSLQILFSLLKHLSTSLSRSSPSHPQFHASLFKKIVDAVLLCPASVRTQGKGKKLRPAALQGVALDADVRELFVNTWLNVHDDIRWFFLREAALLILERQSEVSGGVAENILSLLERISTFPTDPSEFDAWWVEELGTKPPPPKASNSAAMDEKDVEDEGENDDDDWRKYFDEDSKATGVSITTKSVRLHKLTIHQSLHSLASHRAIFTRCWLALLPRLSASGADAQSLSTRALNVMHRGVMPHLTRAVMVMDWISSCVDYGGSVGLLALNSLFILMQEYNLDYPSFYTRLYAFLDRDVLHLKHRARFFRLTETFLSSTHLPANLLASFIKRLSRLSLSAPPAAVIMLIPFTYNILKRHPALMVMIHRVSDVAGTPNDPFSSEEPNPTLTQALDSSLWELLSHRNHYHAPVSTLARIFEEAFTKPGYALEDFLDHTYGTLFETEAKRKIKKEPVITLELSKTLFPTIIEHEVSENVSRDIIAELWTFG